MFMDEAGDENEAEGCGRTEKTVTDGGTETGRHPCPPAAAQCAANAHEADGANRRCNRKTDEHAFDIYDRRKHQAAAFCSRE
jgi:hypothetical protein